MARRSKILTQDGALLRRSQMRHAKAATRRGEASSPAPKSVYRRRPRRVGAKTAAAESGRR
jgi:hypothetical protein